MRLDTEWHTIYLFKTDVEESTARDASPKKSLATRKIFARIQIEKSHVRCAWVSLYSPRQFRTQNQTEMRCCMLVFLFQTDAFTEFMRDIFESSLVYVSLGWRQLSFQAMKNPFSREKFSVEHSIVVEFFTNTTNTLTNGRIGEHVFMETRHHTCTQSHDMAHTNAYLCVRYARVFKQHENRIIPGSRRAACSHLWKHTKKEHKSSKFSVASEGKETTATDDDEHE